MDIGKMYLHEGSGATYVCLQIDTDGTVPVYAGEITDARGTRRHLIAVPEAHEWKPAHSGIQPAPLAEPLASAAPIPRSLKAHIEDFTIINKGEGKVTKKK